MTTSSPMHRSLLASDASSFQRKEVAVRLLQGLIEDIEENGFAPTFVNVCEDRDLAMTQDGILESRYPTWTTRRVHIEITDRPEEE